MDEKKIIKRNWANIEGPIISRLSRNSDKGKWISFHSRENKEKIISCEYFYCTEEIIADIFTRP